MSDEGTNRSRPRMAGEGPKEYLSEARKWLTSEQRVHKISIVLAFKEFWDGQPDENQFSEIVSGLLFFTEILHYMVISSHEARQMGLG